MGERKGPSLLPETKTPSEGSILIKISDIPTEKDLRALLKSPRLVFEAPLQAAMLLTDFERGVLTLAKYHRNEKVRNRWLAELPRGNGEAIVYVSGLLAPKQSLYPTAHCFEELGYQSYYPKDHVTWGIREKSQAMLEAARQGCEQTGKKTKILCVSLGVAVAIWTTAIHPQETIETIDHVGAYGKPLGTEINIWVSAIYLGTQWFNRRRNGRNDFSLQEELVKRFGEDGVIKSPPGLQFTEINSANGVTLSPKNNHTGDGCAHCAQPFNPESIGKIARAFAAENGQTQSLVA